MDGLSTNASLRRYERDFLLQLRLHPFSLQKPKSLKDHEIVKDKLYLHQMENCFVSDGNNLSNFRASLASIKADSEMIFRSRRTLPECYPRTSPLYTTNYKCNSGYHGMPSSKTRSFYLSDSMNLVRKSPAVTSPDYKFDMLDDILSPNWPGSQTTVPWSKQSSYEDLWNSYNRTLQNSTPKDQCEAPVKCKKTLPIIDPSNGKNILEGILNSPRTSQESIEENAPDSKDKGSSSGFEGSAGLETPNNGCETQSVESSQEICAPQDPDQTTQDPPRLKELCPIGEVQGEENTALGNGLDNCKKEALEASNADLSSKQQTSDYDKYFSYSSCEDLEAVNVKNTDNLKDKENYNNQSLPYNNRNNGNFASREGAFRTEEQLKANIKMLKEKLYSMRQEQQKMVIYQSFLRYKKHQLDEIVRGLDDQKIEIANWECNLVSKEKRLKDKEVWLEVKRKNLKNKEEELRERERKLAEFSNELDDGKSGNYTNGIDDGKLDKEHSEYEAYKLAKGFNDFGVGKLANYPNRVNDGKLSKGSNEVEAWNMAKGPEELGFSQLAKYSDVVVGRKLAKDKHDSGEFGDRKLAKDCIEIHYGKLAKGLNEFGAWKLSKDSYDKDFKEIEGAQFDEVSNKDSTLHSKETDFKKNAMSCNGLENFQENGVDYPEVNGEYPIDNMKLDYSKNAGKWSEVQ